GGHQVGLPVLVIVGVADETADNRDDQRDAQTSGGITGLHQFGPFGSRGLFTTLHATERSPYHDPLLAEPSAGAGKLMAHVRVAGAASAVDEAFGDGLRPAKLVERDNAVVRRGGSSGLGGFGLPHHLPELLEPLPSSFPLTPVDCHFVPFPG